MIKNAIIISVAVLLSFAFLVYAGAFRNPDDPLAVARYYFDCLKNREGFLTYGISGFKTFDPDKYGQLYKKYDLGQSGEIKLDLVDKDNMLAHVRMKIIYKDRHVYDALIGLKKGERGWVICEVKDI